MGKRRDKNDVFLNLNCAQSLDGSLFTAET